MEFIIWLFAFSILLYIGFVRYKKRIKPPLPIMQEVELNQKENDFTIIRNWLTADKKFQDPDLKLEKVARGVKMHERQVSSAINTIACQNFNTYINQLRIKEAKILLLSKEHSHFTIDALAEMVGFANKVSFYKAFKKETGLSPADFRKASNQSE